MTARCDRNCAKCGHLPKPDPKCQQCAMCYKSLNLYIGSKGELSADEKEHIAKIKFGNFEKMGNEEKEKILAKIRHRPVIPKPIKIRFVSFFKSLGAALQNQLLIEELANSMSADSGLITETIDFDLAHALHTVLRPLVEKLKLFENNGTNMSDYLIASIDILTICLKKDDLSVNYKR